MRYDDLGPRYVPRIFGRWQRTQGLWMPGKAPAAADPVTASGATAWYDAHDGSGLQQTPSRIGSKVITLGSTTGVDTNDPTYTAGPPAYWINDGTDDYLQLPAADAPTFANGTSGAYTAMVVAMRTGVTAGNYFSSNANTTGIKLLANSSGVQAFTGNGGASAATTALTDTLNIIGAYAFSYGSSSLFCYYHNGTSSTVTASASTAGITSGITHLSPRTYSLAASVSGAAGIRRVYSVVVWNGLSKTRTELDAVAAYLIASHA